MMLRSPIVLALSLVVFVVAGCGGDDPTCLDACENLAACGKLAGTESECVAACEGDPSVLEEDLRCFADSSCSELVSCMPPAATDPAPHPTSCWSMCEHVYGTCGAALQGPGGPLDRAQCASFCRAGLNREQVGCAWRAACSMIDRCF